MKTALIVHTWGIGDWLFFTPVIDGLIRGGFKVDVLLGQSGVRPLVEFYPEVNIISTFNARQGMWPALKAARVCRQTAYDLLLFTAGISSRKADLFASLIRAKAKLALSTTARHFFLTDTIPFEYDQHLLHNNLRLLDRLGLPYQRRSPYIPLADRSSEIPSSLLIHPGCDAANKYKRWPPHNFVTAARHFLREGRTVSVALGPSERDLAEHFENLNQEPRFHLYQELSFRELVCVIDQHEVFLNSDSGLGHIAAALGKVVFCIMGPASPEATGILTPRGTVIQSQLQLDCQPCVRRGGRYGCVEQPCLRSISPQRVIAAISRHWETQ